MVINDLLPARDLSSRNFFKPFLNLFILPVSSTSFAFDSLLPAHRTAGPIPLPLTAPETIQGPGHHLSSKPIFFLTPEAKDWESFLKDSKAKI